MLIKVHSISNPTFKKIEEFRELDSELKTPQSLQRSEDLMQLLKKIESFRNLITGVVATYSSFIILSVIWPVVLRLSKYIYALVVLANVFYLLVITITMKSKSKQLRQSSGRVIPKKSSSTGGNNSKSLKSGYA